MKGLFNRVISTAIAAVLITFLLQTQTAEATVPVHSSQQAINYCREQGYFKGDQNGYIDPEGELTRAQIAAIMVRSSGIEAVVCESPFSDVKESDWFCAEVSAAYYNNIIAGYPGGVFLPHENVSRQDTVAILGRVWGEVSIKPVTSNDYKDVAAYAAPHVSALMDNGVIQLDEKGNFNPKKPITYGELAQFIFNYFNNSSNKQEPVPQSTPKPAPKSTPKPSPAPAPSPTPTPTPAPTPSSSGGGGNYDSSGVGSSGVGSSSGGDGGSTGGNNLGNGNTGIQGDGSPGGGNSGGDHGYDCDCDDHD